MILVPVLYYLSGESRPLSIILYGMALSAAVLLIYLVYRYIQHHKLYSRLAQPAAAPGELPAPLDDAPLPEAVSELLQATHRHYQEQLQSHISRMDQHIIFINRWVHQMKTPLSVIQLTLQELDDEAAGSIQEELERLRKGLEMVIYTSRLERFEDDFQVQSLPLRRIISEAVAENRRLFIRRGIKVDIRVDESLTVYSDAKWLMFMLTQILVNAVNYTSGSGKTVAVTAQAMGKDIQLDITDQGIGISSEDLKRVFNPYFTGERGRQYHESTGMGLYLVREICSRLGHKVGLESKPGEGTTVRIIFNGTGLQ
nr:sensor histidine kinase [Paenibacillus sonchi]